MSFVDDAMQQRDNMCVHVLMLATEYGYFRMSGRKLLQTIFLCKKKFHEQVKISEKVN